MKKNLFLLAAVFLLSSCGGTEDPSGGTPPMLGRADTPVLVEEFSDMQCPACAQITPQVEAVIRANPDVARLVYYHFPLPQHEYAFAAAEASECAADQGRFWEYMELTFKNQRQLSPGILIDQAGTLALDGEAFRTCLTGQKKRNRVLDDLAEGRRRRVNATPTFYVNGRQVGFTGAAVFEAYLKSAATSATSAE